MNESSAQRRWKEVIDMARLPNQWIFVKSLVDTEKLFSSDKRYIVTGVRDAFEYKDGARTNNVIAKTVTLLCLEDKTDYGETKSGKKISNIKFESFDVKVEDLNFNYPKGTEVKPNPEKISKAVAYTNDYGEQVSISFSELDVLPKK